jgi:hypothetical protein
MNEEDMLFSEEELKGSKDMQTDFDELQIKSSHDQLLKNLIL